MSINWESLRAWNGSQQSAFEELCCQLAACEVFPAGSSFVRKGAPDAGIECYWTLPNGDEIAWQAKYFFSVGNSQWGQLDESVKTVLEKHPKLVSCTVCLPIDRADPRIDSEWLMDKWRDRVDKWTKWANEKGMTVRFEYWGEHEIFRRLSQESHRGRYLFWFNKELYSLEWFKNRLEEAINNAGARYTPDVHVDLPIAQLFDGLGRTKAFYNRIKVLYGQLRRMRKNFDLEKLELRFGQQFIEVFSPCQENISNLLSLLETFDEKNIGVLNFSSVTDLSNSVRNVLFDCIGKLEDIKKGKKLDLLSVSKEEFEKENNVYQHIGYLISKLEEYIEKLHLLNSLVNSNQSKLANLPALLLVGEAGTGKTHLLCDIAKHRINNGLPTILLLGGQFNNEEPWTQIIKLLQLSCNKDEFLGILDTIGQTIGKRVLILIDALNEGEGKRIWKQHISGMLTAFSRFTNLGIAFSLRSTYEELIVPNSLVPTKLIKEHHGGFANHEYQAAKTFFAYYGIQRPSIPLLNPEFRNPLFLKLLCLSLKNLGLVTIPSGYQGITEIFSLFIDSINEKLSKPEYLNFNKRNKVVNKAVNKLAEEMATRELSWLSSEEAEEIVKPFHSSSGYEDSLFRHLLSENLIIENVFWSDVHGRRCEGIQFSYERFTDHLIVKQLMTKHFKLDNSDSCFAPGQKLGDFFQDEYRCRRNLGLVEAFSIQIPETVGKELIDFVSCGEDVPYYLIEAFISSLIWRDRKAITANTFDNINEHVFKFRETTEYFLNVLITIATNPEHPYNADFLHEYLLSMKLPQRDKCWSIFLHNYYDNSGVIHSVVDWAWSDEDKSHISAESIRLCGKLLAWFLTSSNRYLRDRATKALVALFSDKTHILEKIIPDFLGVDDPYVLERLFAVAYGCAMRSTNIETLTNLANQVYAWIFKDGNPPVHILLRDYAKNIIELALHKGASLDLDFAKVKPPYNTKWFSKPTNTEIRRIIRRTHNSSSNAFSMLYNSVMDFGDFARYVIGVNSEVFPWTSRAIDVSEKLSNRLSKKEVCERFVESLSDEQKKVFEIYKEVRGLLKMYKGLDESKRSDLDMSEEDIESDYQFLKDFPKLLTKKQLRTFKRKVLPNLESPSEDRCRFDFLMLQRLILKKVLELGWTVERFGDFDEQMNYDYRVANKPERFGKKYQWIAYHEILARVADNFEFRGNFFEDQISRYDGSWQIGRIRDIDPSCLLRGAKNSDENEKMESWWFPQLYTDWALEADHSKWLKNDADFPAVRKTLEITDVEGVTWLNLCSFYVLEQPKPVEEERFENPCRQILYSIQSYIVKKSDVEILFDWFEKNFFTSNIPKPPNYHDIHLGEFFWSPAFNYRESSFYFNPYDEEGWFCLDDEKSKKFLVSTVEYTYEHSGFDCSTNNTFSLYLPAKCIVEKMQLDWFGKEGRFFDKNKNLIAFDPSLKETGPKALLVNKEHFTNFLEHNGYDLIWFTIGEKIVLGGANDHYRGKLILNSICALTSSIQDRQKIDGNGLE